MMSDFISCVAIEQGGYWAAALVAIVATIMFVAMGFCLRVLLAVLKDPSPKIELKVSDQFMLNANGRIAALVVIVIAVVPLVLPLAFGWYLYDQFGDYYSVNIDAGGAETLESIRATFAHEPRTHLTIIVADNLKSFRVQGVFDGMCVADLFDAICRAHPGDLRCTRSYAARSLTVTSP